MIKGCLCLWGELAAHWEKPQSSGLHLNQCPEQEHWDLFWSCMYTEGINSSDKLRSAIFLLVHDAFRNAKVLGKDVERIQVIFIQIPNAQPWVRHLCLDFDGIQGQRRAINKWGWQGVTFILLGGSEMKTAHVIGRHSKRHQRNALAKLLLEVSEGAKDGNN